MAEDWCNKNLENLRTKNNLLFTLNEIRNYLQESRNLEVGVTNRLLSSSEIYHCLEEEEEEKSNVGKKVQFLLLISDILRLCMENLSLTKECCDLYRLLHCALLNKWTRIKLLAIQTIHREVVKITNGDYPNVTVTDAIPLELFHHILLVLREHRENNMGCIAFKIFSKVLEHFVDEPCVKSALIETLKTEDVVLKFRLYERVCCMGLCSESSFQKVEFMLDHAIGELKEHNVDDELQISILEAIEICADNDRGVKYLDKHQVFDVLVKRIEEMAYTPENRPLILSIIRFFGGVSRVEPKLIIGGYPYMMFLLFKCVYFGDSFILPTVFDALVNLTYTEDGVLYLERVYPYATKDIFASYSAYLRYLPYDLRLSALESLESIFLFEAINKQSVTQILHRWFKYLNNEANSMELLAKCCRNRHLKIKTAALYVVRAVCFYPWGIQTLKNTPGFLNHLLKHNIQHDDRVNYAKFTIIDLLADSELFDTQTTNKLRAYIDEYPLWKGIAQY